MKTVTKTGLHLSLGKKARATLRGEKYQVALRGWVEDEYLIVDYPKFQGDIVKIAPLTGCSLSFTSDGVYFDFKTLVLHAVVHPVRLMVLEYPKSFTSYKLRKNNRHKANFPVFFFCGRRSLGNGIYRNHPRSEPFRSPDHAFPPVDRGG